MDYRISEREAVIRLDEGDEIIGSLKSICRKENIESALVSGIGAARSAEIAHYDTKEKKYGQRTLKGMLEIVSLSGNIAMLEGQPVPHIHISLGLHDFSTASGHLVAAEVNPTCEIVLTLLGTRIGRKFDEKTGLNLQRF